MKYLACIDRFKIEKNLKQQHKYGRINDLNPPIMIVDKEKMQIVENCSEIEIIGSSKVVYRPEEKLPLSGVQVTLWQEFDKYKVIR